MELQQFTDKHFDILIEWICSPKLNYLWGGPTFHFPLSHQQLIEHCAQEQVLPFIFRCNANNVGYVELYKQSEHHLRICRVFVSNDFRGQGLAKVMLNQLLSYAQDNLDANTVSLAVFKQNYVAKSCYQSLGFVETSIEKGLREFEGECWDLVLMEKSLR